MSAIFVWWRPFSARTRVAAAGGSWRVRSRRAWKRFGPATAVFEDAFMTEYQFSYLGLPMMSRGAAVVVFSPSAAYGAAAPGSAGRHLITTARGLREGGFMTRRSPALIVKVKLGESPPGSMRPAPGQTASTPTRSSISADRRHAAAIA